MEKQSLSAHRLDIADHDAECAVKHPKPTNPCV